MLFDNNEEYPSHFTEVYPELIDIETRETIKDSEFAFVAPIKRNNVVGDRLLIASQSALFETDDGGATVRRIGDFMVHSDGATYLNMEQETIVISFLQALALQ